MPDEIERIIRRDLEMLPVLPRQRWLPAAPGRGARVRLGALRLTTVVAVIALALGVGAELTRLRSDLSKSVGAATASTSATQSNLSGNGGLSRQTVLSRISQLRADLPRIDRIEAKSVDGMTLLDARMQGGSNLNAGNPADLWWVVAVSGEVRCSFCVVPRSPSYRSALYWIDARSGEVRASAAFEQDWPSGFDSLPDRTIASNSVTASVTVNQIELPNTLVVTTLSEGPTLARGTSLVLRADENTAYSWTIGRARAGNVMSLEELVQVNRIAVGSTFVLVTFEDAAPSGGGYRLEHIHVGIDTD
jgi:hypothetical protein